MQWTVIIPVKPAESAKSRLGLGPGFARAIALDTVAAAVASAAVGRVLVVTSDPGFRPPGAEIVVEESPAGIDDAIRTAAALAPDGPRAALLGDLPSLRPRDLTAALAAALALTPHHPRAFVTDREGTGTTLVTAAAGMVLITAFGPDSAAAHRALGLAELALPAGSTVTADVDTLEHLEVARVLGLGPATRGALESQPVPR
jgi:2-phospho-L-lactate guanylyltransferase